LQALGPISGKKVLEIGAGIGRFTSSLAAEAAEVIACDFMEHLLVKNKEVNGHNKNTSFVHEDATKLELQPDSLDVVFMNWLLMYLNDAEAEKLIKKTLAWVIYVHTDLGHIMRLAQRGRDLVLQGIMLPVVWE